jgi:hypothetical protein
MPCQNRNWFAFVAHLSFNPNPAGFGGSAMSSRRDLSTIEDQRGRIAHRVLTPSFWLLAVLAAITIAATFAWDYLSGVGAIHIAVEQQRVEPTFQKTFIAIWNSILPVVSAWVGAILSYYFAQKTFETGSQSTRDAIAALPLSEALRRISVADKMKPYGLLDAVIAVEGPDGRWSNPLSQLRSIFEQSARSRAPIFVRLDAGAGVRIDSVVHESVFYRFLDQARAAGRNVDELTLEDLLEDPTVAARVGNALAFVTPTDSLAEAKSAMDATPGCQDVFITGDGRSTGAVSGWLTNVDILRYSVAGAS